LARKFKNVRYASLKAAAAATATATAKRRRRRRRSAGEGGGGGGGEGRRKRMQRGRNGEPDNAGGKSQRLLAGVLGDRGDAEYNRPLSRVIEGQRSGPASADGQKMTGSSWVPTW